MLYKDTLDGILSDMLEGFFVGWPDPPNQDTHYQLLVKSDEIVLAVDEQSNKVIGFITAISDGVLSAYIPFLEVLPEYQNQGIGIELMQRMLAKLEDLYMIDLMCDENLQPYYEKLGLIKSVGMVKRNYDKQSGK